MNLDGSLLRWAAWGGVLLVGLLAVGVGCGSDARQEPPPLQPIEPAVRETPATTRSVVRPAVIPATGATTGPATAPSDHHAAPPRRTGP